MAVQAQKDISKNPEDSGIKDILFGLIFNVVNTREEGCKESIKKSRKVAILARRCSDEFKAKCDIKISIHGTVYISLTLHKGFYEHI